MEIIDSIKNMFGGSKSTDRYFTIYKIHNEKYKNFNENYKKCCGRYKSNSPKQAAKKVFRKILQNDKSKYISFSIEIKEITRNSKHKIYKYTFTRVLKDTPLIIKKDDKTIIYRYDIYSGFVSEKKSNKKSNKYICSKKEKEDKKTSVCCSKGNNINKRTYQACKKHIEKQK